MGGEIESRKKELCYHHKEWNKFEGMDPKIDIFEGEVKEKDTFCEKVNQIRTEQTT